ncbi:hypothetical protein RB199_11015 [Streptomyces libani]|uniref:Uncharacterized protein n=1 Tax=Streptomyces nigrescens TaxID=1920 RepID=A0A640TH80_STRNI|nr:hypothetical protein [Streptomyces libani]WAT95801.1 hypothetical protein STRLI_001554 [Streptomyces libani subsp. libani]GFE21075.1 hypothetical protein Sliba_15280 [Streptomyces libani subsp. libani]
MAKDDRDAGKQRAERDALLARMRERIHGKPDAGRTITRKSTGGNVITILANNGGDKLPGEPWPGPQPSPTPDGGPGVPNPPKVA